MVTKTLFKEIINNIKRDIKRFISLVVIIALGSGFYIGMKTTSPVMKNSLANFFNKTNFMDIEIISELGLSSNELQDLKRGIPEIVDIEGSYRIDAISVLKNYEYALSIRSYNPNGKINKLVLLDGELPSKINECVVEESIIKLGYKIGDVINFSENNLKENKLKITGVVKSPLYITNDRGITTILSGNINYYIYSNINNFKLPYFTNGYIKLNTNKGTFSDDYNKYILKMKKKIRNASSKISQVRKKQEIDQLNLQITKYVDEYNKNKILMEAEISNSENELAKVQNNINYTESQIKTDAEIQSYLNNELIKLNQTKSNIDKMRVEIDNLKKAYRDSQIVIYKNIINSSNTLIKSYNTKINELQNIYNNGTWYDKMRVQGQLSYYQNLLNQETQKRDNAQKEIEKLNSGQVKYPYYIEDKEKNYNNSLNSYNQSITSYNSTKTRLYNESITVREKIKNQRNELQVKQNELQNKKLQIENELSKYKYKIDDAKDALNKLNFSDWALKTRLDNSGFSQYSGDVESISNLAIIFPVIFFLVAGLITLTSISRLLEIERTQIGTLIAIGYTKIQLLNKYLIYIGLATIIGSIVGMIVGFSVFPTAIYKVYSYMYSLPKINLEFNIYYSSIALFLSSISTLLVTYLVCRKTINEIPCKLMRPKISKQNGKIMLENIPFIWNRFKLTKKIALRNLFKYKKRFVMTTLGVAGCTALIIAGLGLKSSIVSIIPIQYGKIFDADVQLLYKNDVDRNSIINEKNRINNIEIVEHTSLLHKEIITAKNDKKIYQINLFVSNDNNEFKNVIHLNNKEKKILEIPKNGIIISTKIAKLLNLNIGDYFKFSDSIGNVYKVKITNICESYIEHYVFMDSNVYEKLYGMNPRTNLLLVKANSKYNNIEFSKILNSNNKFSGMIFISVAEDAYKEVVKNLSSSVFIIIISAGLLAFIVLYNLSIINITERKRELATFKVLGFKKSDISRFVKSEMTILTILGIMFGIVIGYYLTNIIIESCEIDSLMFNKQIVVSNYIIAILTTMIFSKIVDLITEYELKKINMIESLKYVE